MNNENLTQKLRIRAYIRKNAIDRKSVQEGKEDRLALLLEEAADRIEELENRIDDMSYEAGMRDEYDN